MCYTGKCKYETYMGDCTLPDMTYQPENFPKDAFCAKQDIEIEKWAKNNEQ